MSDSEQYVIFDLLDEKRKVIQTFRSPVIDETLDPVWTNCSHVFSRVDRKGQLRCTVMDKDSVGTDEYLGSCSISLMVAHVPIGDQQPKSQLHRLPLDTQGTLSFSLAAKASA
jgi:Ca2+-dependent lipid-binding protein